MRIAICDDETFFLEQMESLVRNIMEIEKIVSYSDLHKLEKDMESGIGYDVVFMDIEWKEDMNGTHFASEINKKYPNLQVIYMTAYNDRFAEVIFWEPVNLCGYLVKPVKPENLTLLLNKATTNIEKQRNKKILVQYKGVTESILYANIVYLESSAHQVFISTISDRIAVYKKLDDYEKELDHSFVRNHKSFLVNMNYIKRIDGNKLTLRDGTILPISKGKYQSTKDKFFRFMGEQL